MSLFEFVTVMISMILALTLGQLLSGMTLLLKSKRVVRWHLPHALWLITLGLTLVNHWWSLWDFHDVDWNYSFFLYILIAPVLITLAIGLVAPDRGESGSLDMARQFARVRRPFSALFILYVFAMWFDGPILAGQDPLGAVGLLHLAILAGAALPLISAQQTSNIISPLVVAATLLSIMFVRFRTVI